MTNTFGSRLEQALRLGTRLLATSIVVLSAGPAAADLTIDTHTSSHIEGSLDPNAVAFDARDLGATVTVDVTVASESLALSGIGTVVSGELTLVDLDGGGSSLTDSSKSLLITLSGELDVYLDPDVATLEIHEDLLLRLVGYWAEAPVGVSIGSRTVNKP